MVAATWIGAFSSLIPTWRGAWGQFGLDHKIGSCSILLDENRKKIKFNNDVTMDSTKNVVKTV